MSKFAPSEFVISTVRSKKEVSQSICIFIVQNQCIHKAPYYVIALHSVLCNLYFYTSSLTLIWETQNKHSTLKKIM